MSTDSNTDTASESNSNGALTKEDVRAMLEDIARPSDEDVDAAEKELANKAQGADTDKRGINPSADDVSVGEPAVQPWKRRSVQFLNVRAAEFESRFSEFTTSRSEADQLRRQYKDQAAQMPKRQIADEIREARSILQDAGLSRTKRAAYEFALELDNAEERLHTTSTTDGPNAGFLLPKPFLAELFVILDSFGVARQYMRVVPMASKTLDLKNVLTKVVANWTGEGVNIEASDLVLDEQQLVTNGLKGITSWTRELQEDMAISLLPAVQEQFAESIAEKEDQAAFLGDGTATFGGFQGITNLTGANFVVGETADPDDALTEDNLREMRDTLTNGARMNASWLMHQSVRSQIAKIESGGGDRIFQESIRVDEPDMLLGYPIILTEAMPTYTDLASGDKPVIFGNGQRALMGQRRGLTADISEEAVLQDAAGDIVYNAFQAEGSLLRVSERVAFKTPEANEEAFSVLEVGTA